MIYYAIIGDIKAAKELSNRKETQDALNCVLKEVNKSMNWEKNADWYEVQKTLLTFLAGGYEALKEMKEKKE